MGGIGNAAIEGSSRGCTAVKVELCGGLFSLNKTQNVRESDIAQLSKA